MPWSTARGRDRLRDIEFDAPGDPHLDNDGTAIDWDTECLRAPLDFQAAECVGWGCIVLFFTLVAIGVFGACSGWWSA